MGNGGGGVMKSDADKALDALLDAIKEWGASQTTAAWVKMIDALAAYGQKREAEGVEMANDPYGL